MQVVGNRTSFNAILIDHEKPRHWCHISVVQPSLLLFSFYGIIKPSHESQYKEKLIKSPKINILVNHLEICIVNYLLAFIGKREMTPKETIHKTCL